MIGGKIPRYLLLLLTLGIGVAVIMLSMFYAQYQWLAKEITETSATRHDVFIRESFEHQAEMELHAIAEHFAITVDSTSPDSVAAYLGRALQEHGSLVGIRFEGNDGTRQSAGVAPGNSGNDGFLWLADQLVLQVPTGLDNANRGILVAAFELDPVVEESQTFAAELISKEQESRQISFALIGVGTLATLFMCGVIVWLIVSGQASRIRGLKVQAEKLREADFGEPLPVRGGDDLGELAAVFNDMRDRLRTTIISRDYLDNLLSAMNEAIIVTSGDGTIERINRATTILLGYEENELVGTSIDDIADKTKTVTLTVDCCTNVPREAFFQSKYGESIPVSFTCSALDDKNDESSDRIYAAQNITERRRAEQRIRYLARIDALTKVPNRMQFQHLLQRTIAKARRASKPLCLFYIDIDHFKEINDTFGHLAGDATLETVAERLGSAVPDGSIIGRLAGDEFAVIIRDLGPYGTGKPDTDRLARKLLDSLADPFFVQGQEVFMTASLGIAYYPDDAPNVIDLIRNADAALYNAKKAGGNLFSYYVPSMNEAAVERLMTKSKLKRAFERDELLVHYQPKYNFSTGQVIGAEALVRWELPDRGLILPSDFIPIAEETNLIVEIGEWVLDKVCEDFRVWQRSVPSPGRVSVNLSLKQLRQANFINRIRSILRGHEVSPTSLELEITETTLMENPERTIKLLDQLYGLGLHLAIDDFGTGYSSLSALQQFPISTLKIDKSFVRDIATNPDDATIVGTIIQMGRNLNMDVVAEGVENEQQLNHLHRLECNFAQGLLFGDPMSADNYLELLLAQAEGTDTYRTLFA